MGARRSQAEPGGARGSQDEFCQVLLRLGARGGHEEPRRSQEEPGGHHQELGGARRSPGGARRSQEEPGSWIAPRFLAPGPPWLPFKNKSW